jgi:hypothetical protein
MASHDKNSVSTTQTLRNHEGVVDSGVIVVGQGVLDIRFQILQIGIWQASDVVSGLFVDLEFAALRYSRSWFPFQSTFTSPTLTIVCSLLQSCLCSSGFLLIYDERHEGSK